MKTVTFSHDQLTAVRIALDARISYCDGIVSDYDKSGLENRGSMYWRDQLDIAKQALALVDG